MKRISTRRQFNARQFAIDEILHRIDELSEMWDAETNARKRNAILLKMNELSAKLEVLEAC